jgi:DNA-binding NarL/FixJ family response regulator
MFRIVIADHDERMTLALAGTFSRVDGLEVVGTTSSAASALAVVVRAGPDLVFVGTSLQPLGGLAMVGAIKGAAPGTRVVVVAAEAGKQTVERATAAGADGLLTIDALEERGGASLRWLIPDEDPQSGPSHAGRLPAADAMDQQPEPRRHAAPSERRCRPRFGGGWPRCGTARSRLSR